MGFLGVRIRAISTYAAELAKHGVPDVVGPIEREAVFILDGVGGFQFAILLVRRALRLECEDIGTIAVKWQGGVPGEIWTDLMWYRRNQWMGRKLARRILAFRRENTKAAIHILAYSGGAGIAVFACERLKGRPIIETLVLACPALSPTYNFGPALRSVQRCYALVSKRDRFVLGLGTSLFGTTDRRYGPSGGFAGFRKQPKLSGLDQQAYEKMREIRWTPALKRDGHMGGHTTWASVRFLRKHLLPLLRGQPLVEPQEIPSA